MRRKRDDKMGESCTGYKSYGRRKVGWIKSYIGRMRKSAKFEGQ